MFRDNIKQFFVGDCVLITFFIDILYFYLIFDRKISRKKIFQYFSESKKPSEV